MIEIKNLTKKFVEKKAEHNLVALDNISFTIEKGDIYGIIGMSGAGKSTMLKLIGLLESPTSGTITVNGQDINQLVGKDKINYYRSIGTVFQGYNLMMQKSVFENVAFPLKLTKYDKKVVEERVFELLDIVGLREKAYQYPSKLSGGQRQRVAIARALANNPEMILCDEPTSALDSLTTNSILKLLKRINRELGVTIIIITHEIEVVKKICNKVAVLDHGKLVENGLVAEILKYKTHAITRSLLGDETEDEENDEDKLNDEIEPDEGGGGQ